MTVAELREMLSHYPDEDELAIEVDGWYMDYIELVHPRDLAPPRVLAQGGLGMVGDSVRLVVGDSIQAEEEDYGTVKGNEVIEWLEDALGWTEIFPLSSYDESGHVSHSFDLGALIDDFKDWLKENYSQREG